jgi:hypothetical protein
MGKLVIACDKRLAPRLLKAERASSWGCGGGFDPTLNYS